jgi:phospholipid/cholesterol/gamma-HCH transport system ATP-binding protein
MKLLEIKNLAKAYGEHIVHRDINLELNEGETLGLLGNSGTGKSVLLRSIIGLEYIDTGEIRYKGRRIDKLTEEELFKVRVMISYAFQTGALFDSVNVFENLAYPLFEHTNDSLAEIDKKVNDLLDLIDLSGKGHLMPSDLSGGMRKRVGLARSIIMNPDIILYDEPTAGLDPVNVENIIRIVSKLKQRGASSIFVTHDIPAAVKVCDRIVIIDQGKVAYQGTPDDLMSSDDEIVARFFQVHSAEHPEGRV